MLFEQYNSLDADDFTIMKLFPKDGYMKPANYMELYILYRVLERKGYALDMYDEVIKKQDIFDFLKTTFDNRSKNKLDLFSWMKIDKEGSMGFVMSSDITNTDDIYKFNDYFKLKNQEKRGKLHSTNFNI